MRSAFAKCLAVFIWAGGVAGLPACDATRTRNDKSPYETVSSLPRRDAEVAARHNRLAIALLNEGKLEDAERMFKASLGADVSYGPAHNNLGNVYLAQGRYYLAAWEYEYANQLMPQSPEPLNNLGLVFDQTGRVDKAIGAFERARIIDPQSLEIAGNLARAKMRRGDRDDVLWVLLTLIAERDHRPDWVTWAREQMAILRQLGD